MVEVMILSPRPSSSVTRDVSEQASIKWDTIKMDTMQPTKTRRQAEAKKKQKIMTPALLVAEAPSPNTINSKIVNAASQQITPTRRKIRWRWGVLAALAMA